ncbi:hypothetical protein [Tengunoibacter tsumagoiensis]|uniref:Uncharacterized protein n=1 Tax=Tengunoibacter tsumagoiensis TaxID=2014871 RepID=A0A402A7S4_9CHLR|nr:hypothetical protein [Tengunoibacter tsumagoiensis]GCE15046.1 hypothetical protein KTT_49050 [Tengunoibacter tsumagoiensis]
MNQTTLAIPVPYSLRNEVITGDSFFQQMRERGLSVATTRPIYSDPDVVRQSWLLCPNGATYTDTTFYHLFSKTAFRRLLRVLLSQRPCLKASMHALFPNDADWHTIQTFLQDQELLREDQDRWKRGARCFGIRDLGHTLEWYIAEWFRRNPHFDHLVPVRHGVTCYRGYERGDLDIVALLDHLTLTIECKSTSHVSTQELSAFLQRASIFQPAIALLLIDTSQSTLDGIIDRLNTLLSRQGTHSFLETVATAPGVYWNGEHIYVTSIPESLDTSLTHILRIV